MNPTRVILLLFVFLRGCATGEKRLSDLIFPSGTALSVSLGLGVSLPKKLGPGFVFIVELDFPYPIVAKKSKPMKTTRINPYVHAHRKKWDLGRFRWNKVIKKRQRKDLRLQLKKAIQSLGYDGPECVRHFLCELERLKNPSSMLEDLLLVLFRKPGIDCSGDIRCPFSLLHIMLNSELVDESSTAN